MLVGILLQIQPLPQEQVFGNMRNFEEDSEFEFRRGIAVNRTRDFRVDSYRTILFFGSEQERLNDSDRQARIIAHQKRVQSEMSKLGIK